MQMGSFKFLRLYVYEYSMYASSEQRVSSTQLNQLTHQMRPRIRFAVAKLAVVLINRIVMCVHANCTHVPFVFALAFTFTGTVFQTFKANQSLTSVVYTIYEKVVIYIVLQGCPDLVGSRPSNLGLKTTKGPNSKF